MAAAARPATAMVTGAGGIRLAVREHSSPGPGKPHVVLVHGYPDRQEMWQPVLDELDHDALHLVTYDVRGAGDSGVPGRTGGYRAELLVEDLAAVVEATVPAGEPVHLVGHDWGSVQLWQAVQAEAAHPRLHGRVAGFVSVSGPPLSHLGWLLRHRRGRRARLLRQAAQSWYVYLFCLPWLPELAWRSGVMGRGLLARMDGADHWGAGLVDDAVHGLNLYRANVLSDRRSGGRPPVTDVPVLVVHPERDPFLTDVLLQDLDRVGSRVTVTRVDAGHWLPRSHPTLLARLITEHVGAHPEGPTRVTAASG